MSVAYSQEARWLRISSSLGDELFLESFRGYEELSRLFLFELDLSSTNDNIAPGDFVGTALTFWVQMDGAGTPARYFHGHVRRMTAGGAQSYDRRAYRAEIVPWLWFLTQNTDCRIFQNQTAPDIIKAVFKDAGFTDFQVSLSGTYPTREYCVQYRETDFDFVSRLMEEEGIFYFFTHEDGKHTLVLADAASVYQDAAENEVEFSTGTRAANTITSWEHAYEFRTGKWTYNDFNFETPSTSLKNDAATVVSLPGIDKFERYDYPGRYKVAGDGRVLAKTRIEEEETPYDTTLGAGTCQSFLPASKFTFAKHDFEGEQLEYVLTRVDHTASEPSSYTSGAAGSNGGPAYSNTFRCIPAAIVFRPARITPRPVVRGPQTAVVVGPSGKEIYTDKYGRVKVQFHWDRVGTKDENSSCWIRVSQNWAGKNWGIAFHPRVGQEVIVDFLEGDPDCPIITGRVYNAEQMPPYELPANQTQSVIKTRSSASGTTETFNELRFEDKKDEEEVYFHAEKDFNRVVENNDTLKVGFEKTDPGDQTIDIYNNRTVTIDQGNDTLQVKTGNRTAKVDNGNEKLEVTKGTRDVIVEGNDTHQIKTGDRTVKVDAGNDALTVTQGNQTIKIEAGKSTTEAGQGITLKVGACSIEITTSGITIKAPTISLESTGQFTAKGAMSTVSGDATLTLKGGMVAIN